jgi:cytochrome P450
VTTSRLPETTYPFPPQCPFQLPDELVRLRRHSPVARVDVAGGLTAWLVTRYEDVRTVLTDERFSRRPPRAQALRLQSAELGGTSTSDGFDFGMPITDPSDHARWRRLIGQVLNARNAELMRTSIGNIIEDLLDQWRTQPVDLMNDFAYRLPMRVLVELLAVPDDLTQQLYRWVDAMRTSASSMTRFMIAMQTLRQYAVALVDGERGGILRDLSSARTDGVEPLSRDELISTVILLTVAGYETVAIQLGNGLLALFQHPDQLTYLRRKEVSVKTAVEEILRYAQAGTGFTGLTYATADVRIGTQTIPAGSAVYVSLDAAARDEQRLAEPDRFDLSRGAAHHHLTFGVGPHFCIGASLARVQLQEGISRVIRRFPTLRSATAVSEVQITSNRLSRYPKQLLAVW